MLYLEDFNASWETLTIVTNDGQRYTMEKPRQMWSSILGDWTQYCPADANSDLSMCIGSDTYVIISETTIKDCYTYNTIELRLPSGKLFAGFTTREDS